MKANDELNEWATLKERHAKDREYILTSHLFKKTTEESNCIKKEERKKSRVIKPEGEKPDNLIKT